MSEYNLVNNSDEVNVKIYKIIHPEVPAYLSVAARTDDEADTIFYDWFDARFGRPPVKFMVEDVSASLQIASQLYNAVTKTALPGVAYATEQHGWIFVPADIEAPGPYHLSPKAVVCYEFIHEKDGRRATILAQGPGHAWHIYHIWADLHDGPIDADHEVDLVQSNSTIFNEPRLAKAMRSGITGVVSKRHGEWDVLPPWDECAGDN